MKNFFSYYEGSLSSFIDAACQHTGTLLKFRFCPASDSLISDLKQYAISIDASFCHVIDNSAVKHIFKFHSSHDEELRGQLPLAKSDLLMIPEIVKNYDSLNVSVNKRNQEVILYSKTFSDNTTFYVEEVRSGRKELAACTMYKRKKANSPTLMD